MIEFETMAGARVLVNPDRVLWVEPIPNHVGCFNLVMAVFPVADARGGLQIAQHAVQVKNETSAELRVKLGAFPRDAAYPGMPGQWPS